MSQKIDEIIKNIRELEIELRDELEKREKELAFTIEKHKIRFEKEVVVRHRKEMENAFKYLAKAPLKNIVSAPLVYLLFFPALLLDLLVTVYQWICFPI